MPSCKIKIAGWIKGPDPGIFTDTQALEGISWRRVGDCIEAFSNSQFIWYDRLFEEYARKVLMEHGYIPDISFLKELGT